MHVGPGAVVGAGVRIASGTRLIGQCWIEGPTEIGTGNLIYPNVSIGLAPQSLSYDPSTPGRGVVIGDDNVMREGVTVHRAMTDDGPTTIGSRNFLMSSVHVGHDCRVADRIVMASGAVLAGHVIVEPAVTFGGLSGIHQFCRVGRGAMIGGGTVSTKDVPMYWTVTANTFAGAVNLVGMRRAGMDRREIDLARWVFRRLNREGLAGVNAIEGLRDREDEPLVAEYLNWLKDSKRGWISNRKRASRGTA